MSWAIDRAWASNFATSSGTTLQFTFGGAVAAGSVLVLFVFWENAVTVSSVADDVNGSWSDLISATGIPSDAVGGAAGKHGDAWIFPNSGAGTPTITITFSGTAAIRTCVAGSYSGIATVSAFDVAKGQAQEDPGTGTDAVSTSATGTTAQANELAVAVTAMGASVTRTSASGWTERFNADIGSNFGVGVEDKNIASPSAVTATWTINSAGADTMSMVITLQEPVTGTTRGTPFGTRGTAFNGGRTFQGIIR